MREMKLVECGSEFRVGRFAYISEQAQVYAGLSSQKNHFLPKMMAKLLSPLSIALAEDEE